MHIDPTNTTRTNAEDDAIDCKKYFTKLRNTGVYLSQPDTYARTGIQKHTLTHICIYRYVYKRASDRIQIYIYYSVRKIVLSNRDIY